MYILGYVTKLRFNHLERVCKFLCNLWHIHYFWIASWSLNVCDRSTHIPFFPTPYLKRISTTRDTARQKSAGRKRKLVISHGSACIPREFILLSIQCKWTRNTHINVFSRSGSCEIIALGKCTCRNLLITLTV